MEVFVMISRATDLTGRRFGRLVVLYRLPNKPTANGQDAVWMTKCDCGNESTSLARQLRSGKKQSCGCLRKERLAQANTKDIGVAAFNQVISGYKKNAAKRGMTFDLTEEHAKQIMLRPCAYCGRQPKQVLGKNFTSGSFTYNGIDRIDSTKSYVIGNVVPCCGICNRAKHSMSYSEFMEWINDLMIFQQTRQNRKNMKIV